LVVDLGAGYGEEAIYLTRNANSGIRYIGVEAQPVIYECLANTFNDSNEDFIAVPFAISDKPSLKFVSQMSYASVGETPEAYVEVPTISWPDFLKRYQIDRIDLLKMNIEGAEKEVMKLITDFSIIKRLAISCHDFRADEGDGEWYRSKEIVTKILKDNGYSLKTVNLGIPYVDDWIFAEGE
jgi:FkbM family methyltransferase